MSHQPLNTGKAQNSEFVDRLNIQDKMKKIGQKILVMSGKGGVGKSTISANLATALALEGYKVGLIDVDLHGPSIPTMFNINGKQLRMSESGDILPFPVSDNLKVISVGLFLESEDQPIVWRGPMKIGMIKQFLKDVEWGQLDFLIIDSPPGTGDEPLGVAQQIGKLDGGIVVTTPQEVAAADVRKNINFAHKLNIPIIGVLENMNGFTCPHCDEVTYIFKSGGGKQLAAGMEVPFLGSLPIDPEIVEACDSGKPYVDSFGKTTTAKLFLEMIQPILDNYEKLKAEKNQA
jgi:Mrp family chromosome partitioning ATPase